MGWKDEENEGGCRRQLRKEQFFCLAGADVGLGKPKADITWGTLLTKKQYFKI